MELSLSRRTGKRISLKISFEDGVTNFVPDWLMKRKERKVDKEKGKSDARKLHEKTRCFGGKVRSGETNKGKRK